MRVRVLITVPWWERLGGAEAMLHTILGGASQSGHELELVFFEDGPWPEELREAGLRVDVIRAGREYLTAFPTGGARVAVAMQVSNALARSDRIAEEFALYDQLLRELAVKASGVPVGGNAGQVRSAEYVQVMDKYLSRLAGMHRPLDALRVYRTEVDRNPNDAGHPAAA